MPSRARVKVKKTLTRAEAAAEFNRKKARLRRRHIKRRALTIACVAVIAYAAVGSWWLMRSGTLQTTVETVSADFWQRTAALGLRIDQVSLRGRNHADAEDVRAALGFKQGAPILAVSLEKTRDRLKNIQEIKDVHIARILPNQLVVTITERTPAAWWQKDGELRLIDVHGVVLSRAKYKGKITVPVVVGEDAPKHVGELMTLLDSAPSLKPDVVAAVRVGARRWNVQLTRDIVVMLPEHNPQGAWKRFAGLVEKEALLAKSIRSVDMRIEDRVFIMPLEQQQNPITLTTARDT